MSRAVRGLHIARVYDHEVEIVTSLINERAKRGDVGYALRGNDAAMRTTWARTALIKCVLWRISRSRGRNTIARACCFSLLGWANRMVGRLAASAIASASAASFFCRLTRGLT
jgi:hypothetical protein